MMASSELPSESVASVTEEPFSFGFFQQVMLFQPFK